MPPPKAKTTKPIKEISARRAIGGGLTVVLAAVIGVLLATLWLTELPLQLAIGPAVAGVLAAAWRLSGIRESAQ